MGGKREIRTKILSAKNTQKITKAMQMIAASKMRKTQEKVAQARPYADALVRIMGHLSQAHPEERHPWLAAREDRTRGIILIGTDRGQCGGLNANLFRLALRESQAFEQDGRHVRWGIIGQKAASFFASIRADVVGQATRIGDSGQYTQIRGVVASMIQLFEKGAIDSVWVASNRFVSTLTQKPRLVKILPLSLSDLQSEVKDSIDVNRSHSWDYLYEPGPLELLDLLLRLHVETMVLRSLIDNQASEQAARMIAMQQASDNAGRIIKELQLAYNKARQAAITQEIAEIVAGAAAV